MTALEQVVGGFALVGRSGGRRARWLHLRDGGTERPPDVSSDVPAAAGAARPARSVRGSRNSISAMVPVKRNRSSASPAPDARGRRSSVAAIGPGIEPQHPATASWWQRQTGRRECRESGSAWLERPAQRGWKRDGPARRAANRAAAIAGAPTLPLAIDRQVDRLQPRRVGQARDPAALGDRLPVDLLDVAGEVDRAWRR